jgi:hypothetical protein
MLLCFQLMQGRDSSIPGGGIAMYRVAGLSLFSNIHAMTLKRNPGRRSTALFQYAQGMSVFDEKRTELERHEFMMGVELGRLAVALDLAPTP